jgi:hypothetical protein
MKDRTCRLGFAPRVESMRRGGRRVKCNVAVVLGEAEKKYYIYCTTGDPTGGTVEGGTEGWKKADGFPEYLALVHLVPLPQRF